VHRTILTALAYPDIRIIKEFVLESPLSPNHFLSREGLSIWRQGAHDGTGATLITFFERVSATTHYLFNKLFIRV
jgi:hypothetical protein